MTHILFCFLWKAILGLSGVGLVVNNWDSWLTIGSKGRLLLSARRSRLRRLKEAFRATGSTTDFMFISKCTGDKNDE